MDIAVSPRPMEILLVEDDPDDAFLVQEMTSSGVSPVVVSGFSYRMLVAGGGEKTLAGQSNV